MAFKLRKIIDLLMIGWCIGHIGSLDPPLGKNVYLLCLIDVSMIAIHVFFSFFGGGGGGGGGEWFIAGGPLHL